jgi:hypothetical protein
VPPACKLNAEVNEAGSIDRENTADAVCDRATLVEPFAGEIVVTLGDASPAATVNDQLNGDPSVDESIAVIDGSSVTV